MSVQVDRIVVPGDLVGAANEYAVGEGVYERAGRLVSTLVGVVRVVPAADGNNKATITVSRVDEKPTIVPKLGDIVLGKVRARSFSGGPRPSSTNVLFSR